MCKPPKVLNELDTCIKSKMRTKRCNSVVHNKNEGLTWKRKQPQPLKKLARFFKFLSRGSPEMMNNE